MLFMRKTNTENKIRQLRAKTGLTQEKFGAFYNIPRRTLEDWVCDKRTPPPYVTEMLERLVREDFGE